MAEWPFGRPINGENNKIKSRKIARHLFGHHGPMRPRMDTNASLGSSQVFSGAHTKNIFSNPTLFEVVSFRHATFFGHLFANKYFLVHYSNYPDSSSCSPFRELSKTGLKIFTRPRGDRDTIRHAPYFTTSWELVN